MKKSIFIIVFVLCLAFVKADGGLWPPSLDSIQYEQLKKYNIKLSRAEIYDELEPSLKDAVVLFGGGCTGVVVSDNGLVLTNHHCGYKYIQKASSLHNNYLEKGFFARKREEELANEKLSVRFLVKTIDITDEMLASTDPKMNEQEYSKYIREVSNEMTKKYTTAYPDYSVVIRPLYNGNEYVLYLYEEFQDIRLVYAPPMSIGKFGGNTDNWMWPRYSGDFSLFRIYADKLNKPAQFSKENIPYKPKKVIPISTKGIKENDFSMILGFPGGTSKEITSSSLSFTVTLAFPVCIDILNARLEILDRMMSKDPQAQINHSALFASLSNLKKKQEGIIAGCLSTDAIVRKKEIEEIFQTKIESNNVWKLEYGSLIRDLKNKSDSMRIYEAAYLYYAWGISSIKLLKMAETYQTFIKSKQKDPQKEMKDLLKNIKRQYNDFDPELDENTFVRIMSMYQQHVSKEFHFSDLTFRLPSDFESWGKTIYTKSVFTSYEQLEKALLADPEKLKKDPAVILSCEVSKMLREKVWPCFPYLSMSADSLYRRYEKANKIVGGTQNWPNANGGMRLSYGKVKGYSFNKVTYPHYTTLEEMIEKYGNSQEEDFRIPMRLKSLYEKKDYPTDAEGLPICFTTDCQTSSGNSGSPVFNGKGELIGLNFDRNWEGTMSDYLYSPDLCRNIAVDSRYILFVLDRLSGAQILINELVIK